MLVKHINLPGDLGHAYLEEDEKRETGDGLSLWK